MQQDAIASKLAAELSCEELIILTDVDYVYKDFGARSQEPLPAMTVAQARELAVQGQFEAGTMLPKIDAAIHYLEKRRDGKVLITSMSKIKDAIKGRTGTVITA